MTHKFYIRLHALFSTLNTPTPKFKTFHFILVTNIIKIFQHDNTVIEEQA